MIKYKIKLKTLKGQSLIELVISLGLFAVLAAAIGGIIFTGLGSLERSSQLVKASALAQEGLEAIRAIRNRDWNELVYNQSALKIENNEWLFEGEGTSEQIGRFTRTLSFKSLYRDDKGALAIASQPGSYLDPNSKEVKVEINWEIRPGVQSNIKRTTYLINFP